LKDEPFIPQPNFRTPEDQISQVEKFKRDSNFLRANMYEDFRDMSRDDVQEETVQLAKSFGVYLEWNRDKAGKDKDWMYMVRVSVPGGGGFDLNQWRIFDELATKYAINPEGQASLRVTTRQNLQYHWVKKKDLVKLVSGVAKTGFFTLNGCGDNARNVMGCPLAKFSNVFNCSDIATEIATFMRLPAEPHIEIFEIDPSYIRTPDEGKHYEYTPKLFNRKFKVAVSAVHQHEDGSWHGDNCVELRTNEIGIAPVLESGKVERVMLYIGGGQGENNNKPTAAMHAEPFGVVERGRTVELVNAIAKVHEEWGDRQNRHWARMKYVVRVKGIEWFRQQVRDRGVKFDAPIEGFDPGPRELHHGWAKQPSNGLWAFGAYMPNGRLMDDEHGKLKSMVLHLLEKNPDVRMMTTPNQDVMFTNIEEGAKEEFVADMKSFGWGKRNGKEYSQLRKCSGACVALPTCALAYTDSERFEPFLVDELEARGYGDLRESIGITGCERQCFRPSTKTIGWVGQGPNLYALRLGGSEDARFQGVPLSEGDQWYLRRVPREKVADVCAALFDWYLANRKSKDESMGAYHRRVGRVAIIEYLKAHKGTAELMEKTYDAPYVPVATI